MRILKKPFDIAAQKDPSRIALWGGRKQGLFSDLRVMWTNILSDPTTKRTQTGIMTNFAGYFNMGQRFGKYVGIYLQENELA